MRNLLLEPLLRFETFEALLRWIPQNTEVYVIFKRPANQSSHFMVYKAFDAPPPPVYEEWLNLQPTDVRLGTGAEAEDWLKRQRRLASVRVIRKNRIIRFDPIHYGGVLFYNREGQR